MNPSCSSLIAPLFSQDSSGSSFSQLFHFSSSVVQSLVLASTPFLLPASFTSGRIYDSIFFNITISPLLRSHMDTMPGQREASISDSAFTKVENVYDGGIVQSVNAPGNNILCSNCSFLSCSRELSNDTRKPYPSREDYSYRSCSFSDSLFTLTSQLRGGAIFVGTNGSLNVQRCSFIECQTSIRGGAIFLIEFSNSEINVTDFANCTANDSDGALGIFHGIHAITYNCLFVNCSSREQFGAMNNEYSPRDYLINNCTFSYCLCNGTGGCVGLAYPPSEFSIVDSLLEHSTSSRGGAIYFHSNTESTSMRWIFLLFRNNSSPLGNDAYSTPGLYEKLNKSQFVSCFSTSEQPRFLHCPKTGQCTLNHNENDWLPNPSPIEINVKNSGQDLESCGAEGLECKTVKHAFSRSIPILGQSILLHSETFIVGELKINAQYIAVRAKIKTQAQNNRPIIETNTSAEAFCRIVTGSCGMEEVNVLHSCTKWPTTALFVVEGSGSLGLVEVSISCSAEGISYFTCGLINAQSDGASIELARVKFSGIKSTKSVLGFAMSCGWKISDILFDEVERTTGNGGALEVTVEPGDALELENITFSSCRSKIGDGGGMWVLAKNESKVVVGNASARSGAISFNACEANGLGGGLYVYMEENVDVRLSSLTFTGCTASAGRDVFVSAFNMGNAVKQGLISFLPELTDVNGVSGYERSTTNESFVIPIVVYLWSNRTARAYVHNNKQSSADFTGCGVAEYPCRSVDGAARLHFAEADRKLRLCEGFSFDCYLALNARMFDFDVEAKGTVKVRVESTVAGAGEGLVECSVPTVFTNISFELGSAVGVKKAFLYSHSASLRMKDCSMCMAPGAQAARFSFMHVTSGTTELSGFVVVQQENGVAFGDAPMGIFEGSCTCTVNEMTLFNTTTGSSRGLVCFSSTGNAIVKYCTFSNAAGSLGAIVHVACASKVEVSNSTFHNILRSIGDGSSVCVMGASSDCEASGEAQILNCTLQNCSVDGAGGCGGGVSAQLGLHSSLIVKDTTFQECAAPLQGESGGKGGALFLSLHNTASSFTLGATVTFSSNTAMLGDDVFVSAPDLDFTVTAEHFLYFDKHHPFAREAACGMDHRWSDAVIPLVYYLMDREPNVCVADTGFDVSVCGFTDYPCKTISHALTRQSAEKSILLASEFNFYERVKLSDAYFCSISAQENASISSSFSTISMYGDGIASQALVIVEQEISVERVRFEADCCLTTPQKGLILIACDSALCEMKKCTIGMSLTENRHESATGADEGASAIRCEFCVVEAGKLLLIEFTVESLKVERCGLIDVCGTGACQVNGCVMNGGEWASEKGVFEYCSSNSMTLQNLIAERIICNGGPIVADINGKALTVVNCSFDHIELRMGNGSVLRCDVSDASSTVEVVDTNVTGAAALDGCGGAISVIARNSAHVRIGYGEVITALTMCEAKSGSGKRSGGSGDIRNIHRQNGNGKGIGGAIHVRSVGVSDDIAFGSISFGTDEQANSASWSGKNIFIESDNLSRTVKPGLFGFAVDLVTKSTFDELNGFEAGNESYSIPLAVYLVDFDGKAWVAGTDADGVDYRMCGISHYPCATIPFAITARFGEGDATVILSSTFTFKERIVFNDSNSILITLSPEVNLGRISVASDNSGQGDSVVEMNCKATLQGIGFVLPPNFVRTERCCFLHCNGAEILLEDCSASKGREGNVAYSVVLVTGGSTTLKNFKMEDFSLGNVIAVEVRGAEASAKLENVTLKGVNSESMKGLALCCDGGRLDLQNATANDSTAANHCVITVSAGSSSSIQNCSFTDLIRREGDGGVVVGEVCGGAKVQMKECVFRGVACVESGRKGGSVCVHVAADGVIVCENNTFEGSTLVGEESCGGALYLNFEASNVVYSMRNVQFSRNEAGLGSNVFLVCPTPRVTIDRNRWIGSAVEGQPNKTMWVMDTEEPPLVNTTLLKYLFPTKDNIIFVNKEYGSTSNCGDEDYPCAELFIGYDRLGTEKDVLQIIYSTELTGQIVRQNAPLTIRGRDSTSASSNLVVGSSGHLVFEAVSADIVLSIERIVFTLPYPQADHNELLQLNFGKVYFVSCIFGVSTDAPEEGLTRIGCSLWIACCSGGELQFCDVAVKHLDYVSERGVVWMQDNAKGRFNSTNVTGLSCTGSGLIYETGRAHLTLENCTIEECTTVKGGVMCVEDESGVESNGGCVFRSCTCDKGSGGWMKVMLKSRGSISIKNTQIEQCVAYDDIDPNSIGGKGGGAMLAFGDNFCNDILLQFVSFTNNDAELGKDLFIECKSLNETVTPVRFEGVSGDKADGSADLRGSDRTILEGNPICLDVFLVQRLRSRNFISSQTGLDLLGCGETDFPCKTFWRAVANASPTETNKELIIEGSASIADEYNLSSFDICSSDNIVQAVINVVPAIPEGRFSAVMVNEKTLKLRIIDFSLPSDITSFRDSLISSSSVSSELLLLNCSFFCESSDPLRYSIIYAHGGVVRVEKCVMCALNCGNVPFRLSCTLFISNCILTNIVTPASCEGGALHIELPLGCDLSMAGTTVQECSCSIEKGFGGAIFLDASLPSESCPFLFRDITLADNKAWQGKNMFICSSDLNKSVTADSFKFDFSSGEKDENMFAGEDGSFGQVDLLIFLIKYEALCVTASTEGADVVRCGSAELPCFSFWKAMRQFSQRSSNESYELRIADSTILRNNFDVSEFVVFGSAGKIDGYSLSRMLCEGNVDGGEAALLVNRKTLKITSICIAIGSVFGNAEDAVIVSESGELAFMECVFETCLSANEASGVGFVMVKGGNITMTLQGIRNVHSGKPVFKILSGCFCQADEMAVDHVELVGGSLIIIEQGKQGQMQGNGKTRTTVVLKNSTFVSVTREGNGSSVAGCSSSGSYSDSEYIWLEANGSRFEGCKAGAGEKGGMLMFLLQEEGHLVVSNSQIAQCACSMNCGRGGGVYVDSSISGELDMLFSRLTFKANLASVGNDVFVRCESIETQINETHFRIDLGADSFNSVNAIYGIDLTHRDPVDLMNYVSIYQSNTILVSTADGANGSNERQCGSWVLPCRTLDYAVTHLSEKYTRMLLVQAACELHGEADFDSVIFGAAMSANCSVDVLSGISRSRSALISSSGKVTFTAVSFVFASPFVSSHSLFLEALNGTLSLSSCRFAAYAISRSFTPSANVAAGPIPFNLISVDSAMLFMFDVHIRDLEFSSLLPLIVVGSAPSTVHFLHVESLKFSGSVLAFTQAISIDGAQDDDISYKVTSSTFQNVSCIQDSGSIIHCEACEVPVILSNCTIEHSKVGKQNGGACLIKSCCDIRMDLCEFSGEYAEASAEEIVFEGIKNMQEAICHWNSSAVELANCSAKITDTAFTNWAIGALSTIGGVVNVEKGEFLGNDPLFSKYSSTRRNILCEKEGKLNIEGLKGGDGMERNASLWILNDGCELSGIVLERASEFFIPTLEAVEMKEVGDTIELTFRGTVLLPCNLQFQIVSRMGEVSSIETHAFSDEDFVSEVEVHGRIGTSLISTAGEEVEVSAHILFGNSNSPSTTESFILKNRSETKSEADGKVVEGGKEGKSFWPIIVIAMAIILLIVLVGFIIFVVRWKKAKNENKDLREIVNDNIRKDPKAFEMVTMEMSPEEQWRRAEKEAEKKNEERIKKRINGKEMVHSESEEYLLSESGSTEYILGKDSDKIPDWALEKIDEKEEEESRKRTPSPSISSTSTTDTSDTDTTFVRMEDACPTTSSMSNLVDAMSCSSPHEKLIVDLRDSLFMLLHGRNEKKEMAIGTLEEREMTAAQILFWVANGALHSLEKEEMPLQSLDNLSPHIVLFSEHMVICIAMHSDCSSDSDSSSISSSSTVITSSSDYSTANRNGRGSPPPSSAFEEDDDLRKEYLRWKAPELMNGAKQHTTKKGAVFSIGMMLWECLTLQIPFGEYEAVVAGQKIVNGERPVIGAELLGCFNDTVAGCLSPGWQSRPTLVDLKREFIQRFPAGLVMLTVSDAIDVAGGAGRGNCSRIVSSGSGSESWFS
ncbi:uncharacterized protein MONOS_5967 [Monocercomonoides exilis]|uniref:uncharacterized protein n=1 Tax=Monocercomonoides exilis TaxID=2049356 RepID=UPI0035599146|nr:hypothetical protein MONOS_5967 [Monocercomonoides exilis]|eukprot:MONOS_5967.1-p1 / transcript=MONOS_5967.1 / gene=MONOS_5967 / organism=Monocercomonoides_exilis_PA203 / gene_product=unspecified product / transcript_product=unspecified product / location=Mono_scaffold00181:48248-60322(+) / protein_length=4024 / sequence_SO=supercontig / SO=protein_coding / is_pseudo=false